MTAPDWLLKREGQLKLGSDGKTWFVLFGEAPIYSIVAVPVTGKFGSVVRQTNNGNRIAASEVCATNDEAIQGGLNDLRKALGWA